MKYGFIKVAAITPTIAVADCVRNAQAIGQGMRKAAEAGVQIAVFPELCLSGYTCGDLFLQESLIRGVQEGLLQLLEQSRQYSELVSFIGMPLQHRQKLYNCAVAIQNGRILAVIPKRNLPNYSEFYEQRHFAAGTDTNDIIGRRCPLAVGSFWHARSCRH